jgi:hypothetical protein
MTLHGRRHHPRKQKQIPHHHTPLVGNNMHAPTSIHHSPCPSYLATQDKSHIRQAAVFPAQRCGRVVERSGRVFDHVYPLSVYGANALERGTGVYEEALSEDGGETVEWGAVEGLLGRIGGCLLASS